MMVGNVDAFAAGGKDLEAVLACRGGGVWKAGYSLEACVQGLGRTELGDGAEPAG